MTTKISIISILLFFYFSVSAQTYKFGYIDTDKLVQELPESKTAKEVLEKETKDAEKHITTMQTEYQKLYQEYMENDGLDPKSPEKWSSLIKSEKEAEITALGQRIQEFEQSATASLQKKQTELLQPIIDKVNKAISEVGKEGKYTEIKEKTMLLYYSEEQFTDVTPLVRKKLGLTN